MVLRLVRCGTLLWEVLSNTQASEGLRQLLPQLTVIGLPSELSLAEVAQW